MTKQLRLSERKIIDVLFLRKPNDFIKVNFFSMSNTIKTL